MILDTNALSALADGEAGPAAALREAGVAAIPVVVLGEYRFGITHSKRREAYENWLDANLPACRVLDVTGLTAIVYAGVRLELKRQARRSPPMTPGSPHCASNTNSRSSAGTVISTW